MNTTKRFPTAKSLLWSLTAFTILLISSCKNLKENNMMLKTTKNVLISATDSIYSKQFNLNKKNVFMYTSAQLRVPKFKRDSKSDTIIMTRRIAIKGINTSDELVKKQVEWKVRLVPSGKELKIVDMKSAVVRDIKLWHQVLFSLLITILYFWAFMAFTYGSLLKEGWGVVALLIFSAIQLFTGIAIFGSFLLSLLNTVFMLFLLSALSQFAQKSAK